MTPLMIYAAHQAALRHFALSLCRDPHRAADLVQQTFLKVCEHADTLEDYPPERIQGWLMLTLRRAWIDHLRGQRREQAYEQSCKQAAAPGATAHDEDFTGPQVFAALGKLPDPLRQTVLLRHFQGLNATEIGARMDVPPATVRTRLRTAAKLLRADYLEE